MPNVIWLKFCVATEDRDCLHESAAIVKLETGHLAHCKQGAMRMEEHKMKRFYTHTLLLLVAAVVVNRAVSQEPSPVATVQSTDSNTDSEQPMSVFNDEVRRFRFELEEMLITAETAEQFMLLHQARNEPSIIGAYADSETNSLVVVGPPDAEQPIRETLAKWIVDRQGVSPPPLNVQKRRLEFRRRKLLREMADLEIHLLEL